MIMLLVMTGDEKREEKHEKLKFGLTRRKKGGDSEDDEGRTTIVVRIKLAPLYITLL